MTGVSDVYDSVGQGEATALVVPPRIELKDVSAEADAADEARVTVSISYLVRQTNTRKNLVFPFYLKTEEDEPASLNSVNGTNGANNV